MKVAFATLGCRVNKYESEAMAEKFLREGYEIAEFNSFSDTYVINTCSVTNMGEKKSRQMIGRARKQNPNSIIAVVGCYAQIASEEVSRIEGVDVILGSRNKGDIVYWVNRVKQEKKQIIEVKDVIKNNVFESLSIENYKDNTRAFLKIQDGCNRFCSYCLIPYARGAVCSKEPSKVLAEVNNLAEHGFKEIILSGIHTASYGIDLKEKFDLIDLIEAVDKIEGIKRIRIGSIDPLFFSPDVIKRIKKLNNLCPHFHLSLQSGCDDTLRRMNRHYTANEYENIVNELRKNLENVSITTDVIVGFPGETKDEFNITYNFLKNISLTKTHIFKYSKRKGTKAELMENQVDGNIKEERSSILNKLSLENETEYIKGHINSEMDVLYENMSKSNENIYEGYTSNYIKVVLSSDVNLAGKILKTIITGFEISIKENLVYATGKLIEKN